MTWEEMGKILVVDSDVSLSSMRIYVKMDFPDVRPLQ